LIAARFVKYSLILAGILFATLNLIICATAHFDMRVLTTIIPYIICLNATPLGIAIASAVLLWHARNHPEAEEVPAIEASAESTDDSSNGANPI
jgi:type VI protein secretion system component VasK